MAIELFKQYIPVLDELYKKESLSAVLDGANELARQGYNANELVIPKMTTSGLSNYSRSTGYSDGEVSISYETVTCNFDKGKKFTVDVMDDVETMNIAFGKLASTFVKDQVVPYVDAFRFSTYAAGAENRANGVLTTGEDVIKAIRAGVNTLDEAEVYTNDRYLFITPTLYGLIQDLDTTKSKEVLNGFTGVVLVPQTRFYTQIQEKVAGGYEKGANGRNIDFIIVQKDAVIQYDKHVQLDTIDPAFNADSDGYIVKYRNVGIADIYENKTAGIYVHAAAADGE